MTADERPAPELDLHIVVPVYNEATQLAASIDRLTTYLTTSFPFALTTYAYWRFSESTAQSSR